MYTLLDALQKEAKKRQQERRQSSLGDKIEVDLLQVAQDETVLSSPGSAKPQPPKMVDKLKVIWSLKLVSGGYAVGLVRH